MTCHRYIDSHTKTLLVVAISYLIGLKLHHQGNILEICGKYEIPRKDTWRLQNSFPGIPMTAEYVILDTDYETFYAGYNCRELPLVGLKMEGGWIFTRVAIQ